MSGPQRVSPQERRHLPGSSLEERIVWNPELHVLTDAPGGSDAHLHGRSSGLGIFLILQRSGKRPREENGLVQGHGAKP